VRVRERIYYKALPGREKKRKESRREIPATLAVFLPTWFILPFYVLTRCVW